MFGFPFKKPDTTSKEHQIKQHTRGLPKRLKTDAASLTATATRQQPEAVLFIPHTPKGALRRQVQDIQDKLIKRKSYQNIRIVERQGPTVGSLIVNPECNT